MSTVALDRRPLTGAAAAPRAALDDGKPARPFTTLSAIGNGYGITNTAVGVLLVLGTTLPLGGAPLLFWGFLLMTLVGLCTAVTLAELCSAMPHPGGQYVWAHRLAPPRWRRFLAYAAATTGWLAAVLMCASTAVSVMLGVAALVALLEPGFVYRRWMGFVGFQALNLLTALGACFKYAQPRVSKLLLLLSCAAVGAAFVALFALAPRRARAGDLLGRVVNVSGWPDGVAFLIGLNGPNWTYSCLDVATHLAEEIPAPATNIPRALMWTILVGFACGMLTVLALLVNLPTIDGLADNSAIAVIYRVTGSKAAAVALWVPILVSTTGALWGVHTWQSRLAWTLSREAGFPLHRHFSRVAPAPFYTPVWSIMGPAAATALLGCLYLGSDVAFNSLTATAILLQYISYSIPVVLVLARGRALFAHGPFWYPRLGLAANVGMLTWTAVALVFYCFPTYLPVTADRMNYTAAILALVPVFILSLWVFYARKHFDVKEVGGMYLDAAWSEPRL